ncbi:hypothetical protein [Rhodopirellula islandica]|nr:hypothetical protein [Rhodopirellula islandica]
MQNTPSQARGEADSRLRERGNQSLKRLGFDQARFVSVEDKTVKLSCPILDRNDRCIVNAAIRLLAGVSSVKFVTEERQDA